MEKKLLDIKTAYTCNLTINSSEATIQKEVAERERKFVKIKTPPETKWEKTVAKEYNSKNKAKLIIKK